MICVTPKNYIFDVEKLTQVERAICNAAGIRTFDSMQDFIELESKWIEDCLGINPYEDEFPAYYISENRNGYVCDRGIFNPFLARFDFTSELRLLHFLLTFEM